MDASKFKSIKDNSMELENYLRDLQNWEKDIHKKDQELIAVEKGTKPNWKRKGIPPPRGTKKSLIEAVDDSSSKHEPLKEKSKKIASYDYAAWDKFNVDEALSEIDKQTSPQKKKNTPKSKKFVTEITPPDSAKNKESASKLKDEGNNLYSKGLYVEAVAKYSEGIALDPCNHFLYANRAMANIKLERGMAAESDCNSSLSLEPSYLKAYLRRGAARVLLKKYQLALNDYTKVLDMEPHNKHAKDQLLLVKQKLEATENHKNSVPPADSAATETNESKNNDTSIMKPITKPLHLQSKKTLRKLPVKDVQSMDDIPPFPPQEEECAMETDDSAPPPPSTLSSPAPPKNVSPAPVEHSPAIPSLSGLSLSSPPPRPKTSHQFCSSWGKVCHSPTLALKWIESFDVCVIRRFELEVDTLVSMIRVMLQWYEEGGESALREGGGGETTAVALAESMVSSSSFNVNSLFFTKEDEKEFVQLLKKMEGGSSFPPCLRKQLEHFMH